MQGTMICIIIPTTIHATGLLVGSGRCRLKFRNEEPNRGPIRLRNTSPPSQLVRQTLVLEETIHKRSVRDAGGRVAHYRKVKSRFTPRSPSLPSTKCESWVVSFAFGNPSSADGPSSLGSVEASLGGGFCGGVDTRVEGVIVAEVEVLA
jgi:hypothetical protein